MKPYRAIYSPTRQRVLVVSHHALVVRVNEFEQTQFYAVGVTIEGDENRQGRHVADTLGNFIEANPNDLADVK